MAEKRRDLYASLLNISHISKQRKTVMIEMSLDRNLDEGWMKVNWESGEILSQVRLEWDVCCDLIFIILRYRVSFKSSKNLGEDY